MRVCRGTSLVSECQAVSVRIFGPPGGGFALSSLPLSALVPSILSRSSHPSSCLPHVMYLPSLIISSSFHESLMFPPVAQLVHLPPLPHPPPSPATISVFSASFPFPTDPCCREAGGDRHCLYLVVVVGVGVGGRESLGAWGRAIPISACPALRVQVGVAFIFS